MSTAYTNCDQKLIQEKVYPSPVKAEKLIDACEWMPTHTLKQITPQLLMPMHNMYTYTKKLAESYVAQEFEGLPCAIVRPSIIGATWREPFPGWIDNLYGPCNSVAAQVKIRH